MYEWLSAAASRLGAPHTRSLSRYAVRLASVAWPTGITPSLQREVLGLVFPGPVGLAAGFDKHGELFYDIARLGFGFAEIGSVIPRAEVQRSRGLEAVVNALACYLRPHPIPLGISISMNKSTSFARMPDDYRYCMERLWRRADYITINLGVRAGPDLHLPEHGATLLKVLGAAKEAQSQLARQHGMRRPLLVKIDLERGRTDVLLDSVLAFGFDGLVLSGDKEGKLNGYLEHMAGKMPVISVGGICTPQDAADRLSAGASLVQIYSGLVESGPLLPRHINAFLAETDCRQGNSIRRWNGDGLRSNGLLPADRM